MSIASSARTLTAAEQWTDPVALRGAFNLSIGGAEWVATVTVQRSYDGGAVWRDVASYAAPAERVGVEPQAGVLWRAGTKAGAHASGSIPVRLAQ